MFLTQAARGRGDQCHKAGLWSRKQKKGIPVDELAVRVSGPPEPNCESVCCLCACGHCDSQP